MNEELFGEKKIIKEENENETNNKKNKIWKDKKYIIILFISIIISILIQKKVFLIISIILFCLFSISLIVLITINTKQKKEGTQLTEVESTENIKILNKSIENIKEEEEEEIKIEETKIEEINKRQEILRKEKIIQNETKNENLEIIEKAGKFKSLSEEEIKKEQHKTQLLEDMNAMGTIMKEQIIEEKKTNPEKFYTNEEIIKQKDNEDNDIYALGIFSKVLENQGIVTAIEKENDNKDNKNEAKSKESAKTSLEFLINGMSNKPKYNLHFDFGKEKNTKLLNDENERKIFHDKLRKKLSREYNINEEDIIITFPRK